MLNNVLLVLSAKEQVPHSNSIRVFVNNEEINPQINPNDQYGNITITFDHKLADKNIINIKVSGYKKYIRLVDIIVDDIRFGLVTFLCTTVSGKQTTQVELAGQIDIEIETPIWQYWCEKMNKFNYKDYPLGSIR